MNQLAEMPEREGLNADGRRRLVQVFVLVLIYAACLFIPAGTLRWWNACAYLGFFLLSICTAGLYLATKHPAIVNERGRKSQLTKDFDRLFARLYGALSLGAYVLAGLDFRLSWTGVALWAQVAAFAFLLPCMFVPYWVMWVNRYAATTVRVETDRGHTVVKAGPYHFVRHPMYAGMLLGSLFLPLALNSLWMYLPIAVMMALVIWRTVREDAALQAELPGYSAYVDQVHYRLMPGVW